MAKNTARFMNVLSHAGLRIVKGQNYNVLSVFFVRRWRHSQRTSTMSQINGLFEFGYVEPTGSCFAADVILGVCDPVHVWRPRAGLRVVSDTTHSGGERRTLEAP